MYDHSLYLKTLSEFTATLLVPYDLETVLDELAARLTDVLGLAGSGVSLARDDRLHPATAIPPRFAELERVQYDTHTGPCADAFRTGRMVAVGDVRRELARWPEYCAVADRLDVVTVAGIPMRLRGQTLGALSLYARTPRKWLDQDLAAAVVMADMATGYLINASKIYQQDALNQQLQGALESRVVIEQAKGMIASADGISVEEAFRRIRGHARDHNVSIRTVAESIVRVGLRI